MVPPYREGEATILSPASAIVKIVSAIAAAPEEVESAPTPPSSELIRSSKTSLVGLFRRV